MSKKTWFICLIIITICLVPLNSKAAEELDYGAGRISVILLIDTSLSMKETDPRQLREKAAGIFVDLLSADDYFGVITFSDTAEVVWPLQEASGEAKKEIKEVISKKLQPQGNTDFLLALQAADKQFASLAPRGTQRVIVLLTDGRPEPVAAGDDAFMKVYMSNLWTQVQQSAQNRQPIYTVGFSEHVNPEVLDRLAMDTRADAFSLQDSSELSISLFRLLGDLKSRKRLLERTVTPAVAETITFPVDAHSRQVNVVAYSPDGSALTVEVLHPDGRVLEARQQDNVSLRYDASSLLLAINEPKVSDLGEWSLRLTGGQAVTVFADADLKVRAQFQKPLANSQHPLHEPLHLQVKTEVDQDKQLLPLTLDAVLYSSDKAQLARTTLIEKNPGIFEGDFPPVNTAGTYELVVHVNNGGVPINSISTNIYVKAVPVLKHEFQLEKTYSPDASITVSASLFAAGKRLAARDVLKLTSFTGFILTNGIKGESIALYDSGDMQNHGDMKAGDGIWSNLLQTTQVGPSSLLLQVNGSYKGTEFFLEQEVGMFSVQLPGTVKVKGPQHTLWTTGSTVTIPLLFDNRSDQAETITVSAEVKQGVTQHATYVLQPQQHSSIPLKFELPSIKGSHTVTLTLAPASQVQIDPVVIYARIDIVGHLEGVIRRLHDILKRGGPYLFFMFTCFFCVYGGGMLLFVLFIRPRRIVTGSLSYYHLYGQDGKPDTLELRPLQKQHIVITFDRENKKADFYLAGSEFRYDLVLTAIFDEIKPKFLQGWLALRRFREPVRIYLTCTKPGVIEFNGKILTKKELFHEDEFESEGFYFQYHNAYGRWYEDKSEGMDVLEGKV